MANRDFKNVQALERELKIIAGRVTFSHFWRYRNDQRRYGFRGCPRWQQPGDYTITLTDKYTDLLHCSATYVQLRVRDTLDCTG